MTFVFQSSNLQASLQLLWSIWVYRVALKWHSPFPSELMGTFPLHPWMLRQLFPGLPVLTFSRCMLSFIYLFIYLLYVCVWICPWAPYSFTKASTKVFLPDFEQMCMDISLAQEVILEYYQESLIPCSTPRRSFKI